MELHIGVNAAPAGKQVVRTDIDFRAGWRYLSISW